MKHFDSVRAKGAQRGCEDRAPVGFPPQGALASLPN